MTHAGIELISSFLADSHLTNGTIDQRRAAMDESLASAGPPDGVVIEAVTLAGRPAEWVVPSGVGRDRAVLYLHGGGYCIGSIASHRDLGARLALASGTAVCLLDYRLAPEHPFPGAVDDAAAAYRELVARDIAPSGLALAGDSAGGGLVFATLLALRAAGDPLPAAAVGLSPWVDLTQTSDSYDRLAAVDPMISRASLQVLADAYLADADPTTPLASPLYGDLGGLPPLLIEVGENESLLDEAVALAERARAAGVDVTLRTWTDMIHVFQAFPPDLVPEAAESITGVAAFLAGHLSPSPTTVGDRSENS
jgi:acetyl esterase/lipase